MSGMKEIHGFECPRCNEFYELESDAIDCCPVQAVLPAVNYQCEACGAMFWHIEAYFHHEKHECKARSRIDGGCYAQA